MLTLCQTHNKPWLKELTVASAHFAFYVWFPFSKQGRKVSVLKRRDSDLDDDQHLGKKKKQLKKPISLHDFSLFDFVYSMIKFLDQEIKNVELQLILDAPLQKKGWEK